jgi:dTDP-4-dehydrorhamnose reductase
MVVILGATGYIGQAFAAELRRRAMPFVPLTRATLDYTRFDVLFNYVRSTKPRLIINAAGYTGRPTTASCEAARAETIQANTLLPQIVARVCYLTKTPMGHVSSGEIFTGAKVAGNGSLEIERNLDRTEAVDLFKAEPARFRGFSETDEPNHSFSSVSSDFYSGSKALAEDGMRWFDQVYLWRPGAVFDETDHPRNLLSRLHSPEASSNSLGSLSHRGDFVGACLDLWENHAAFGRYHVVNPGIIDVAQIIEMSRGIPHSAHRMESQEHNTGSALSNRRPLLRCILDSSKLQTAGIRLRPASEALENAVRNWQTNSQSASTIQLS